MDYAAHFSKEQSWSAMSPLVDANALMPLYRISVDDRLLRRSMAPISLQGEFACGNGEAANWERCSTPVMNALFNTKRWKDDGY
ncbi:MAG: hypothetical protein Q8R67_25825 [Rhodoferax sp.]|nr:hypothetical protein [Rhodoferax sp.]MDP3655092.1 hypothetical protein [Rhodoferax sp.]